MHGAIPPVSQYAFMVWCLVTKKAQEHLYLTLPMGDFSFIGVKVFEITELFWLCPWYLIGSRPQRRVSKTRYVFIGNDKSYITLLEEIVFTALMFLLTYSIDRKLTSLFLASCLLI
jgi:hypothetical protein